MNSHETSQSKASARGLSAIVVQYGPPQLLIDLVASLSAHADAGLFSELIVVDNGGGLGDDGRRDVQAAATALSVRFIETPGTSYSGGVNAGVSTSTGNLALVMNNDLVWTPEATVRPLVEAMREESTGIAGPQLLNVDGSWQRSFGRFPSVSSALESLFFIDTIRNASAARAVRRKRAARRSHTDAADKPRVVDYVDGAMMCVRRRCFDETGGLDESLPFYGEDTDFCYRAQQRGWNVLFVPDASVVHVRGATSTRGDLAAFERKLFASKVGFVVRTAGERKGRLFARLLKAALAARARLYPIAAAATGTETARDRAAAAHERYEAVRGISPTRDQAST